MSLVNQSSNSGETSADADRGLSLEEELASAMSGDGDSDDGSDGSGLGETNTLTRASDGDVSEDGDQSSQESKPDETPLAPHEHWSKEDKEAFAAAPRSVQAAWLRREAQIEAGLNKKFQELSGFRKEQEELQEIFAPYSREMELAGLNRAQAIRQLVAAHNYLQQDPLNAIAWLAQNYQIDPSQFSELYASSGKQEDPEMARLRQELNELRGNFTGLTAAQEEARRAENVARVQAFAEEKDETGKPKHPHFDEVANEILLLLKGGEKDLETAYKRACLLNDSVRTKMEAEKVAAKRSEVNREVSRAKRAGFSVESNNTGTVGKPISLEDELRQGFGFA